MHSNPPVPSEEPAEETTLNSADLTDPPAPILNKSNTESVPAASSVDTDTDMVFMDPLTGHPSSSPDPVKLALITRSEPRYALMSIPGCIYFICSHLDPAVAAIKSQLPASIPFRLSCTNVQENYTRLYTQWLFSGCATNRYIKLHNTSNGATSVSFHPRIRAAVYLCRLYAGRKESMNKIKSHLGRLFKAPACPNISDGRWQGVVLKTERTEVFNVLWYHLLPDVSSKNDTPTANPEQPSRTVSMEPFRGSASLAPQLPRDMTPDWHLWTPVTSFQYQASARAIAGKIDDIRRTSIVDPAVLVPRSDREARFLHQQNGASSASPKVIRGPGQTNSASASDNNPLSAAGRNKFLASNTNQASASTTFESIDPNELQLSHPTINPLAVQYESAPIPPRRGRPPKNRITTTNSIARPKRSISPRPPTPPTFLATTLFEESMDLDPAFNAFDPDKPVPVSPLSEREAYDRDVSNGRMGRAANRLARAHALNEVWRGKLDNDWKGHGQAQRRRERNGEDLVDEKEREGWYDMGKYAAESMGFVEKDWELGGVMNPE